MSTKFWPIAVLLLMLSISARSQQPTLQEEQDFRFAIQLENKGLYDLAALQFERFADSYPMSVQAPQALFSAAADYAKVDSLARAAENYRRILLKYPQSDILDKSQFEYARLLQRNGEKLHAALAFGRIKILDAKSKLVPDAQIAAAQNFMAVQQYQKAYDAANYILEYNRAHPLRLQAYFVIAQVHEAQGDYSRALAFIDRMIGDRMQDELAAQAFEKKATLLVKMGRYVQADSVLKKLVFGDYAGAIAARAAVKLAASAQAQRDYEFAKTALDKALAKAGASDKPALYLSLGDNYFLQHDWNNAKANYEQASGVSPALYHYRLGFVAKSIGDFGGAIPHFETVANDTGVSPTIRRYAASEYADALARDGRAVDALRFLQPLAAVVPQADRSALYMTMARLQEDFLHDFSGARQHYSAVIAGDAAGPLVDDAQYYYARTFDLQGRFSSALEEYNRYLTYYQGGDFIDACRQGIQRLQFFAPPKERPANTVLSELAGESLRAPSQASVAYSLARLYLAEQRDYARALPLLQQAALAGDENIDRARLDYEIAASYFALYLQAVKNKEPVKSADYAQHLAETAAGMSANFPATAETEQVEYWNVQANLPSISNSSQRGDYLREHSLAFTQNDSLAHRMRLLLVEQMVASASDSSAGDYEKAVGILDDIIESEKSPLRGEALYKKALLLKKMSRADSAIVILQELSGPQYSEQRADALMLLGLLYESKQDFDSAQKMYAQVSERYFYSNRAKTAQVKMIAMLLKQGRYKQAKAAVEKLRAQSAPEELRLFYPRSMDDESLWLWANVIRSTQTPQQAMHEFQKYLDLGLATEHAAEALFAVGELADKLNKPDMALSFFTECSQQFPADSIGRQALVKSADLSFDRGHYVKAGQLYLKMKGELTGELQQRAFKNYIICEFKQGHLSKAANLVKEFKKQYDDRNAEARFLYEEGAYYVDSKNLTKAEKTFKRLSSKYDDVPEGARGELGLARLYVVQTKTEDALKRLTKIPQNYKDPDIVATAYLNLADFYYENRALENSITAGRKVLALQEGGVMRAQALDLLINAYDDLGMRDQAVALEREYIEKYPNSPDLLDRRIRIGTFLYYLKEYDRAIVQLKGLAPIVPADEEARVRFWIAESYAAAGFTEQAIIEYLKVRYQCRQTKLPFGVTALYKAGENYRKLDNLAKAKEMFQQVIRERGAADDFGRAATKKIQEIDAQLSAQL